MGVNKVEYFGNTLIDLTSDTVTAGNLVTGYTAHGNDGSAITGTLDMETAMAEVSMVIDGITEYHILLVELDILASGTVYSLEETYGTDYVYKRLLKDNTQIATCEIYEDSPYTYFYVNNDTIRRTEDITYSSGSREYVAPTIEFTYNFRLGSSGPYAGNVTRTITTSGTETIVTTTLTVT